MIDAHAAGAKAWADGLDEGVNPCLWGGSEYADWRAGWLEAREADGGHRMRQAPALPPAEVKT